MNQWRVFESVLLLLERAQEQGLTLDLLIEQCRAEAARPVVPVTICEPPAPAAPPTVDRPAVRIHYREVDGEWIREIPLSDGTVRRRD